jgi:hypothetical protein
MANKLNTVDECTGPLEKKLQNKEMRHQVVQVDKSIQTYGWLLTSAGYIGTNELLVDSKLADHKFCSNGIMFFA